MAVSNELAKPLTEEAFEAMCHVLYGLVYKDYTFTRMGGAGQKQFGVDILGLSKSSSKGIQCKHYNKTPFTLATVIADIDKAEKASLEIEHLLFATTASSKSDVVKDVHKLSLERQKQGKFSVSVHFWEDISGHISVFPEIGRSFIPGFPGSTILEIKETSDAHLELYQNDRAQHSKFQASTLEKQEQTIQLLNLVQQTLTLQARGDEADPLVVASLDSIRDKLREGKCRDGLDLLKTLGDPSKFRDEFSRFRWHTNYAFVDLLEGRYEEAADGFLKAFDFAPDDEKALSNKAHAFIIKKKYQEALTVCNEALFKFPKSEVLWSLKLNVLQSLGDPSPEKDLPKELYNSSDVLFSLATISREKGDLQKTLQLLQECMVKDGGSFNAKRTYLADALTWCSSDPVLALNGQLNEKQREILTDAVSKFEPLEKSLPIIQSDHISEELVSNTLFALMLLDQRERASTLASQSLFRHPLHEGLLRIKLQDYETENNIKAIHQLTDHVLEQLPTPIVCILTEISANQGDLVWYNKLIEIVETKGLERNRLERLKVISIQAERQSGNKIKAIEVARNYLSENPDSILARVILSQMLGELGKSEEAVIEVMICFNSLTEDTNTLEQLQVADLLYWLKNFSEASQVFSRLVKTFGGNELTRKFLICLIESDQRRKARDILDQLSPEVRQLSEFRRVEANLARRMGDWARMRDLLAEELTQHPGNIRVAVSYVGALFRLNDLSAAETFLESDPKFEDSVPEIEFEFAKYQAHAGLTNLAIKRLYRLYRDNSSSSQAASFYLCQILIGKHTAEMDVPGEVKDGSVVYMENTSGSKCIAIDIDNSLINSWPELVSSQAEIAKKLRGLKIGDFVEIDNGFNTASFEIKSIESIYGFVSRKAHELISVTAEPSGPLYSFKVIRDDGTPDIQLLLNSAEQRREHVKRVFDSYKQYRLPLAMMADALGSDPITLILEWPFKEVTLFVSSGLHHDRLASQKLIKEKKYRYVLDLLTIAELVRWSCFDQVVKLIGRPLVPSTVQERLLVLLQAAGSPQASSSLGVDNGQLLITDTPPEYYENRLAFLNEMKRCVENHCDVLITTGPQEINETHRTIAEALDGDSMDAIYLSIEKDAILVSEDGALRALAKEAGVSKTMEIQPILLEANESNLISKKAYANIVFNKLAAAHDFVSIRADELSLAARQTPYRVSEVVIRALDSFRKPTLEIISGVNVSCDFIVQVMLHTQPRVAVKYIKFILEVLSHERSELAALIKKTISSTILNVFNSPLCKMKPKERRLFNDLLSNTNENIVAPQKSMLSITIQNLFYKRN